MRRCYKTVDWYEGGRHEKKEGTLGEGKFGVVRNCYMVRSFVTVVVVIMWEAVLFVFCTTELLLLTMKTSVVVTVSSWSWPWSWLVLGEQTPD